MKKDILGFPQYLRQRRSTFFLVFLHLSSTLLSETLLFLLRQVLTSIYLTSLRREGSLLDFGLEGKRPSATGDDQDATRSLHRCIAGEHDGCQIRLQQVNVFGREHFGGHNVGKGGAVVGLYRDRGGDGVPDPVAEAVGVATVAVRRDLQLEPTLGEGHVGSVNIGLGDESVFSFQRERIRSRWKQQKQSDQQKVPHDDSCKGGWWCGCL